MSAPSLNISRFFYVLINNYCLLEAFRSVNSNLVLPMCIDLCIINKHVRMCKYWRVEKGRWWWCGSLIEKNNPKSTISLLSSIERQKRYN